MRGTIRGQFLRTGADQPTPYITALVQVPRLSTRAPVRFLVDTGASRTTLHPSDAETLSIDAPSINDEDCESLLGVGGSAKYRPEAVRIGFRLGKEVFVWPADILIGPCGEQQFKDASENNVPSLLGRDFLSTGHLVVDYVNDVMSLELHTEESIKHKYDLAKREYDLAKREEFIRMKSAPRGRRGPRRS